MLQMATPSRKFLELTIVGAEKKLYIPADSVLTYELVPEGKNPTFPQAGSFLRYDYGEGVYFAMVNEPFEEVKLEIGTEGFIELNLIDDAPVLIKDNIIQAIQEVEDDGVDCTRLSVMLGGQMGSIFVKDSFKDIKSKRV